MPLFPRLVAHNPSIYNDIRPLLQAVLQDPSYYDNQSQSQSPTHASSRSTQQSNAGSRKAFSPAFDVRETERAYILEGELPGLYDKKAVDIEFTDHQTLLVKGHIEKSVHHESPKEGQAQIEEPKRPHTPPKPTVEDDVDEDDRASSVKMTPTSSANTVTTAKTETVTQKKQQQPQTRYWITERSVGSFQRSFSFPGQIDQDAVTASLANGILTIIVPKKQMHVTRKIEIQ